MSRLEISSLHAGVGDDLIVGRDRQYWYERSEAVMLSGGDGNDTLKGAAGDDFLIGGAGVDMLYGRQGQDTYIVTDEAGEDIIADFLPVKSANSYDYRTGQPIPYTVQFDEKDQTDSDVVVLPDGVTLDQLHMSWGQVLLEAPYLDEVRAERVLPGYSGDNERARMAYATLDISWGSGQTVRVVMPHANDPQGTGVELFRFADGTTLTLAELLVHGSLGEMPDPYLRGANLESDGEVNDFDRHLDNAIPLAGGIGNDTLTGSGKLEGWDGDDVLTGRDTNDVLNGGRGADTLIGGGGNDYLGMVFDEYYSEGNTYIGGTGNDTLFGSQAADTYRFARGDGQDLITDLHHLDSRKHYYQALSDYGGPVWSGMPGELAQRLRTNPRALLETPPTYTGRDTLALGEGIAPTDVTFRFEGRELLLEFGHGDGLRFENWLLHEEKPLKQVVFADGTVWGEDWIAQLYPHGTAGNDLFYLDGRDDALSGLKGNDTLYGYGGNDWLAGGPGDDRLYGGVGNDDLHGASGEDWLRGEEGNDTLVGGAGADTLEGGIGDDLYHADSFDTLIEYASGGTDTVMTSESWKLEENFENLVLVGNAAAEITGNDLDNRLRGNDADNYLTGGRGADFLWGLGGNDVLDGGAGNDTLVGGLGNDAYVFSHGDGNDVIVENDSTTGNQDGVMFYTSIDVEKLWFRQVDQDLEIQLSGTSDSLLIRDWYKGNAHHVERFDAADGRTLLDSQVQNLVDAMAAFGAPAGGLSSLPDTQRTQLEAVIAANWQ